MKCIKLLTCLVLIMLPATPVAATIIVVPDDQPTIQAGIDVAHRGDTVLVMPGTYVENLLFKGESIFLLSSAGWDSTIIEPAYSDSSIVVFNQGEDSVCTIDGFTIRNAVNASGVFVSMSGPTIRNCNIYGCTRSKGAGILCDSASAKIEGNLIHDNVATGTSVFHGAGIYVDKHSPTGLFIHKNLVYLNIAKGSIGIGARFSSRLNVSRNIVFWNDNHPRSTTTLPPVAVDLSSVDSSLVLNNTVVSNGKGVWFYGNGAMAYNNLVAFNTNFGISNSTWDVDYNLVYGGAGAGPNGIEGEDPQLFSTFNADFSLLPSSPCVDAGHPDPQYNDPDGSRCDIGAIPLGEAQYPAAYGIRFGPDFTENISHSETPAISWSYVDVLPTTQTSYQIEVGTDSLWDAAEMWTTGEVYSADSTVLYTGLPLEDHTWYFLRVRVGNSSGWSVWKQYRFICHLDQVIMIPADFLTIGEAVDVALDGDTIMVSPGTYEENLIVNEGLTFVSESGPEQTLLQTDDPGLPLMLIDAPDKICNIEGLTFTGVVNDYQIFVQRYSDITVRDCIFRDIIDGEWGLLVTSCPCVVERNVFYNNPDAVCVGVGDPVHNNSKSYVYNNTFVDNALAARSALLFSSARFKNNIVAGCSGYAIEGGGWGEIDYNCFFDNFEDWEPGTQGIGTHNIFEDPLLVDPVNGDLSLTSLSPCVDAGDPDPEFIDPDGSRNDIGAFYLDRDIVNPFGFTLDVEDLFHITDHIPEFVWSVPDSFGTQQSFEIEVGTDNDWSDAEMWESGAVYSEDTTILYDGSPLLDGGYYYARFRLDGTSTNWSNWAPLSFRMNSNPSVPAPKSPTGGQTVPVTQVRLSVYNSTDPEADTLTYDFEIHKASSPGDPYLFEYGIPEGDGTTATGLFSDLSLGTTYLWRARSFDGLEYSEWTAYQTLVVVPAGVLNVPSEYSTIQSAIDAASNGDSVIVAAGTYTGDGNRDIDFDGKLIVLHAPAGPDSTVIDCQGGEGNEHRGFYFHSGESDLAVVSGFSIINGDVFTTNVQEHGGGILVQSSAGPTILNCVFENNDAVYGGGIYCNGYVRVENSLFRNGLSSPRGLMVDGSSASAELVGCTFDGDEITCRGGYLAMTGCQITDVSQSADGAAVSLLEGLTSGAVGDIRYCSFDNVMGSLSGAVYVEASHLYVEGCTITNADASSLGGAIYNWKGSMRLVDCDISESGFVSDAGPIYCNLTDSLSFSGCSFIGNSSSSDDGASVFVFESAAPEFRNCVFGENENHALCLTACGTVAIDSCLFYRNVGKRGAIYGAGMTPEIKNSTFVLNTVTVPSSYALIECPIAPVVIQNTIIAYTIGGEAVNCSDGSADISCTDIFGNEGGDWVGEIATLAGINGNISLDPEFCDSAADNFTINAMSPCSPYNSPCSALIGSEPTGCTDLCGDCNASGGIDIDDIVYLINYVFQGGPAPAPGSDDVNCSGSTDIDDVVYLINHVFQGGNAPCDPDGDGEKEC